MRTVLYFLQALIFCIGMTFAGPVWAQSISPYAYDIGSPTLTDYYIDPVSGSDDNDGLSIGRAWNTVQHAWAQIPESTTLTRGYRFNLMNGEYGSDHLPNYWELRRGTASAPIILQAASGQSSVRFVRDINMANVSYFYLLNINITPSGGGDAFHAEASDHILLRGNVLNGGSTSGGAHETVKINQSQYVYIENNNILNADDNNIDFVAVQYGHIIGNKVHAAEDWCAYVKGGSAYIRVEANEFYDCGTGGFTAGQGSGFQFMTSPWVHYEAYDIKVINNLFHDTIGAAFGTNGGYNILFAHNTAYKVGTRDHLVEVVFGERTCDGVTNGAADATCASLHTAGGWGPSAVQTTPDPIGNRNVTIENNVIYNPSGTVAPQHFAIYGPRTPTSGNNISSPQQSDTNLVIKGNVIWNGTAGNLVGVEDPEQGCQSSNPTCDLTQLQVQNTINSVEPLLADPENDDLRPRSAGALLSLPSAAIADFPGGDRVSSPLAPEGVLSNSIPRDLAGASVGASRIPGAYAGADSVRSPAAIGDSPLPEDPALQAPEISLVKVTQKRRGRRVAVTVTVTASGDIDSGSVVIRKGSRELATDTLDELQSGRYRGSALVTAKKGARLSVAVSVMNSGGSDSASKVVNAK